MPLHPDGYTFPLAPSVTRTPVRYQNRFGILIAADLYEPVDLDRRVGHAAIVIGPPHGGVKEQGPGIYANQLAQRGFVALTFDPSYNGESGGEPRHITSPEVFAEDFSAAVDFVGSVGYVDRESIGALGICGSGGFALSAAQIDTRIKAVATAAMYDISGVKRDGWQGAQTDAGRREALNEIAAQRWSDVDAGAPALGPTFPDEYNPEQLDPITSEFQEYYVLDRGHHPRSIGAFTLTSEAAHINHGALAHLPDISPRPVLFISGDKAHSRYFSERAFHDAVEPKQLTIVPGARHIDLYDRLDLIPFDTLDKFFTASLAASCSTSTSSASQGAGA